MNGLAKANDEDSGRAKKVILLIAAGVIAAVPVGLKLIERPAVLNCSVRFARFEQRRAGGETAVFIVTNVTSRAILYQIYSLEMRLGNQWSVVKLDTLRGGDLRPGAGYSWAIPVASTNSECRVRMRCVERGQGWRGIRDRLAEVYFHLRGQPTGIWGGRSYDVASDAKQ